MAIFVPELSDEELGEQIDRVIGYITEQNGTITEVLRESPWGRRRLAYTIRFNSVDYRDGIYVVFHYDATPDSNTGIERELKLDVRVIRYLLVHDDPLAGEQNNGNEEGAEGEATEAAEGAEGVTGTTEEAAAEAAAPAESAEVAETSDEAATTEEAAPVEEAAATEEEAPATEVTDEAPAADAETSDEETKED
jgi:small subunit ribosomal protein S6